MMLSQFKTNRNLIVMVVTIIVNVAINFTWYPVLPLYLRDLGAGDQVGLSFTLMGIARTTFAILGGALADRFGRKILLTLPHFIMAILYLCAGFVTDWIALVAILVITNALNALISPAFNAILTESVPENRAAGAFSASEAAVLLGLIGGPLAGAALLPFFSVPVLISLYGAILCITVAVRWFGISEPRHTISKQPAAMKLRAALDARVGWYIVAFGLTQMAFNICFGPYFAILANEQWGNTEKEVNLLFALGSAASFLGIPLGQRADRWGTQKVATLGLFISALTIAGWGIAPTWQWGVVPLLLAFFFSEGAIIAVLAMQAQITSRETRASVMGVITTVSGLLSGLGPVLAAGLIQWGGNAAPFVACGAMCMIAIFASARVHRTEQIQVASAE